MKVLCNVVIDKVSGMAPFITPLASSAQVDSADICNSGETFPHHHMDWRFIKHYPQNQVVGWVNRLEVWLKYAETVAKKGRECDPLYILGEGPWIDDGSNPKKVGKVLLPNYGNAAVSLQGKYTYEEVEKVRSDEDVADVVQFRSPFSYLTTYLGYTRARNAVPYPTKWLTWKPIRVVLSVPISRAW